MAALGHQPVLAAEVVSGLGAAPGKDFLDGTLGDGGHARALLDATAPAGKVLAIDWDLAAIERGQTRLQSQPELAARMILVHGNFKNLATIARDHRFIPSGGCLLDLGLSSPQLDDPRAGFSFVSDRLDFRFDRHATAQTAADIINRASSRELAVIFREYGEEPLAGPIARAILHARRRDPITRADTLAVLVAGVYRRHFTRHSRRHPATRVFLALRVAVNDELGNLRAALAGARDILPPGARLAVISYHSLEDRLVKNFFRTEAGGCLCPPDAPRCQCQHQPTLRVMTRHPLRPSPTEVAANPRSRSAKLRLAERLARIAPSA